MGPSRWFVWHNRWEKLWWATPYGGDAEPRGFVTWRAAYDYADGRVRGAL